MFLPAIFVAEEHALVACWYLVRRARLMWELENATPFAAERTIAVDVRGRRQWVVALKGTFEIHPDGSTEIAKVQQPVLPGPEYRGEPGFSSLLYAGELCPLKPRTDILVNAVAHAPEGKPVSSMVVGLVTPQGNKALRITGDRRWERNLVGQLEPTPPLPFVEMPIVYERASGGWDRTEPDPARQTIDLHNPVGTGVIGKGGSKSGTLLCNIEYATAAPGSTPAGYGPIPMDWEPRRSLHGTYDAAWVETRRPLLPTDYKPLARQTAPIDQQISPHLRGGEPVGLVGMRQHGQLSFTIPTHRFGFRTSTRQRVEEHAATLDTVLIEPEESRLILLWRTSLDWHEDVDEIESTYIWEKKRSG